MICPRRQGSGRAAGPAGRSLPARSSGGPAPGRRRGSASSEPGRAAGGAAADFDEAAVAERALAARQRQLQGQPLDNGLGALLEAAAQEVANAEASEARARRPAAQYLLVGGGPP